MQKSLNSVPLNRRHGVGVLAFAETTKISQPENRNPFYTGTKRRITGRKKIAILIAKPMFHRIDRSVGRSPR